MALIRGVAAGAAVLLLLTGCRDRIESANEAAEVANAQLATTLLGAEHRTVEAIDMGDRWRLSYNLEEGSTGGPIIVVVNKRTGEIVHVETEQ